MVANYAVDMPHAGDECVEECVVYVHFDPMMPFQILSVLRLTLNKNCIQSKTKDVNKHRLPASGKHASDTNMERIDA